MLKSSIVYMGWGAISLLVRLPTPVLQHSLDGASESPHPLRTVVIDAGHGGKDPGTHGRRVNEKTITLQLALKLGRKITQHLPGVRVIQTRSTDTFVNLYERGAIANRGRADLFISIHCNAHPRSSTVHGSETYTLGLHKTESNLAVAQRENTVLLQEKDHQRHYKGFNPQSPLAYIMLTNYQHAFMGSSIRFAQKRVHHLRRQAGRASHGVKQAGFAVLWRTTMPCVLVEAGYLTNPVEEEYLASKQGQDQITSALLDAITQYKDEVEAQAVD